MKRKISLMLALVIAMSTFLAACGDKETDTAGKKDTKKKEVKQELRLIQTSDIPSMDTSIATDAVSFEVMNNVLEGLYRLGEDGVTPTPGMAESHEVSEDGLTYTFKLRDAKWSNGEPVTAKDFEFGWKRTVNPDTAAEYAYIYDGHIKNAGKVNAGDLKLDELGVKALDDKTLEVKLEVPVPYFLTLTTFPPFFPQNEKFVTEQGDKFGTAADKVVYNGPFTLSDWKVEVGFTLKKNPTYWDASTVKLEKIDYSIVKEVGTAVNLYNTGEIDRVGLTAEFVDKYKSDPNFGSYGEATVFFLRFNQADKMLANVNARKAINMAWDKQLYVDTLLNNGSTPAFGLVPKNFVTSPDGKDFREQNGDFLTTNKEEAAKLWETAKKEVGVTKYTLELLNYDSDSAKKDGEFLKEELEKALPGLTVELKQQPFKQKLELESKKDYQMSYAGWGPDYLDPMTFVDMFVTDGPYNQSNFSNKELDKLVKSAKGELTSDPQKRWDALLQAEKLLMEDAGIAPMYQRGRAYLKQPYVKNMVKHPIGGDWSFKWASIEK